MANLDLKEKFLKSPELAVLARMLKSRPLAIGFVVEFWELASEFWARGQIIPEAVFANYDFPEELFNEAVHFAERRDGGIYAVGSEEMFNWIRAKRDAGRNGGIASGISRSNKINKMVEATAKQTPSYGEANPKQIEPPIPVPIPKEEERIGDTHYVRCNELGEPLEDKRPRREKAALDDYIAPELMPVLDILKGRGVSKALQEEWLKSYTPEFMIQKIKDLRIWEINAGAKGKKKNWGRFYSGCFSRDWDSFSRRLPGRGQEPRGKRSWYAEQVELQMAGKPNMLDGTLKAGEQ